MERGNSNAQTVCHTMKNRIKIQTLLNHKENIGKKCLVCGWVKTMRKQKNFSFLELNDGSCLQGLQIILDSSLEKTLKEDITTGSSLVVEGKIVPSVGSNQTVEMHALSIQMLGACPATYPLQKKRHSFDFLRTIAHLRPRTNTQGAVARVRSQLAFFTHRFFQEQGFIYLQSPIITSSDCEGAGALFQITTLNIDDPPRREDQAIDYTKDFFSRSAYLTVSGQLNAETYACALSDVYTFGPTFRAENSHTTRHLAEFWMIEPEIAFADLDGVIQLATDYLTNSIKHILNTCEEDMRFFDRLIRPGQIEMLNSIVNTPFQRLSYTEAIKILLQAKCDFDYPIQWGDDLQAEHERFLTEQHFKAPLVLTDYPKEIKAFYMRENDDGKTVAAFDLLVPKIGEIIGGSQREERYDHLVKKFKAHDLDETYDWYLDLRRFGTVPHGGFGVGFERFVQLITGIDNIRDVNAFPRIPNQCSF